MSTPLISPEELVEIQSKQLFGYIRPPHTPYWFCRTHEKALATLTNDWLALNELLGRGFGTLSLCELEHLGLIERKLEPLPHRNALPSDFTFYRIKQKL